MFCFFNLRNLHLSSTIQAQRNAIIQQHAFSRPRGGLSENHPVVCCMMFDVNNIITLPDVSVGFFVYKRVRDIPWDVSMI